MENNKNFKISVAMCTYNGERFVREQLDSIANQSRLPDEVVICDDISTDSTRTILEDFAESAPFPVNLVFNQENLGFIKNFEKAISLCSGDIIFLSDQDDIWHSDKIITIESKFQQPEVGMVCSNAEILGDKGLVKGQTLWQQAYFTPDLQASFERGNAYQVLYNKTIVSGCTMAFRRDLWKYITPLPEDVLFIHDAWIAMMSSFLAEAVIIKEPLMKYRVHQTQSMGLERPNHTAIEQVAEVRAGKKFEHYKRHHDQLTSIERQVKKHEESIPQKKSKYLLNQISHHKEHLILRAGLPDSLILRLPKIIKELLAGRYHRFSNGFKSAVVDLLGRSD